MYDGAEEEWRFRQTGILVSFPELSGSFFIGRTKEGYSAVKVMTGYYIWTIERSQALDAFVPILGDGVKYMGYYPRQRIHLSLGAFGDVLSENEKFSTADNQFVTRLVWQPVLSEAEHRLTHIGVMGRRSRPDEGKSREKSKPADFLAPNFLDTGTFPADHSQTFGIEAYHRAGPWLFGAEYNWQKDEALAGGHPRFRGGDISVVWLITGETRPYNAKGAYFESISPLKTVFEGGPGAFEATLNLSFNDFDDGSFRGGKFWRLSPKLDWHLADFLHVAAVYGYGVLDRFGVKGTTQFFQTRFLTYY
jgi:phosphate-selective porin OprO/OprP